MQCAVNEVLTELGCIPRDPIGFAQKFYAIGLSMIGGVALLFLIIGGYFILVSQGNPQKLETGKSYLFYAVVGLLLAIFGFVFMQVVLVDFLKIPGFS